MSRSRRGGARGVLATAVLPLGLLSAAGLTLLMAPGSSAAQDAEAGGRIYDRWCAECHGAEGEGDGPSATYMLPRPRDFVSARYQVRTTATGALPTDEDLLRVIRDGIPGTTMPGWPNLSSRQQRDVVAYLKTLSPFFEHETPEPLEFTSDPGGGDEALESGREAYVTLECNRCHGEAGRGDGPSAPTLEDWRELPILAADLTEPWRFNGGGSAEEIHARLVTGLDGTPMPTQQDAVEADIVSADELWHLAHYVASLGPTRAPRLREVVRVERREDPPPEDPDDPAWSDVDAYYFPLVGQVIQLPRNFAPAVRGVWVQGMHDGRELALRLVWNDRSRSPDPSWTEWQEKVAAAVHDDGVPLPTEPLPDAFAVQLPFEVPGGMERPYFLMGSDRTPVYLWHWDAQDGGSERRARGLARTESLEGGALTARAVYEAGQWRLVFRRALEAEDGPGLAFPEGTPVPVAFFAWDGSNAEDGTRAAVGSWYYLVLEEPTSRMIYVTPLVVILLTGGLGIGLVRRAQRRWNS